MNRLFIALFAASVCAAQVPDGQEVVRAALANTEVYEVLPTGSMIPSFDERYWLVVAALPFRAIRLGDVILYDEPDTHQLICHRVVRKSSDGSVLVVRGDANSRADRWLITEVMYRGTVVAIVRRPDSS